MTGPCFVDANVLVYARDARDPRKHARAADWLDHLWRTRFGRTSTQVISQFYAVATRKLKPAVAPGRCRLRRDASRGRGASPARKAAARARMT